jgi:hypothetical protein
MVGLNQTQYSSQKVLCASQVATSPQRIQVCKIKRRNLNKKKKIKFNDVG